MPRNVRNFWFDAYIPGRRPLGSGPAKENGDIHMQFYIREKGAVALAFTVLGAPGVDGKLHLRIDLKHPGFKVTSSAPVNDQGRVTHNIHLITER